MKSVRAGTTKTCPGRKGVFNGGNVDLRDYGEVMSYIFFFDHAHSNVRGHHPRSKKSQNAIFPRSREAESRGFSPEGCKNAEANTSADKCGGGP
jgi:hypothetical protein